MRSRDDDDEQGVSSVMVNSGVPCCLNGADSKCLCLNHSVLFLL